MSMRRAPYPVRPYPITLRVTLADDESERGPHLGDLSSPGAAAMSSTGEESDEEVGKWTHNSVLGAQKTKLGTLPVKE